MIRLYVAGRMFGRPYYLEVIPGRLGRLGRLYSRGRTFGRLYMLEVIPPWPSVAGRLQPLELERITARRLQPLRPGSVFSRFIPGRRATWPHGRIPGRLGRPLEVIECRFDFT